MKRLRCAKVPRLAALACSIVLAATAMGAASQSGTVKVPDGELYYEMQGSGPTVVLLHGGLLDGRMWDEQFGVLAERFRVLRYDARGHGKSSRITGDYCNHRDLHALLTALGIRRATLVGLSLGGRTAIDFTLVHPEMVESLVAVSSGISGWDFTTDAVLQEHQVGLRKAADANDLDGIVGWFQRSWTDGPRRKPDEVNPAVRERVRAMARANIGTNSRGTLEEVNAVARLGEIRVPMLAVLGDLDMPSIRGIFDLISAKVPGVRTTVIPGAAHLVNMEKPAEFNRVLLAFLGSLGRWPDNAAARPTLSADLKILEPLVNRRWVGEMSSPDGSRRLRTDRNFEVIWDGTVVKFTSGIPETGSSSEGYFYWDREAKAVAAFIVNSRGVYQRGTVTAERNVITIEGRIVFPERAFEYRNTFEVLPDGKVIDRWFQNAFGPWQPGHVVELTAKQ